MIVRGEHDDRHALVDERDRPVLHLTRRITLGVDVRDLFQLQRAFERDRVVDAAAEIEKVGSSLKPRGDLLDLRRELQRLLEKLRQLQQRVDVRFRCVGGQRAATCPSRRASRYKRDELRGNAFVDATPISGPACV